METDTAQAKDSSRSSTGNYAVLKGQVDSLSGQVTKVEAQVERLDVTLSGKIDRQTESFNRDLRSINDNISRQLEGFRGKGVNWGWILSGAGLAAVLAAAVITPINSSIGDNKQGVRDLIHAIEELTPKVVTKDDFTAALNRIDAKFKADDKELEDRVTLREHDEFKQHITDEITADHNLVIREVTRIDGAVNGITTDFVRRPEILAFRADDINRINSLSRNLEDTRKDISQLFPSGDVIKNLQNQVAELTSKMFNLLTSAQSQQPTPQRQ